MNATKPFKQQSSSSSDSSSTALEKLKLLAEELVVERRQVETGQVRVNVVTREHQELVDIPLAREQRIVEEVVLDKIGTDHIETVHEKLRRQQAEVERVDAAGKPVRATKP